MGNQKDVDVLLKEQKPPEDVLKEGLVVFLNMCFGVAIVRANINTMSGTFKIECKILDYKCSKNGIVRQCNSTADVCRIVPVERMCRMLQIFQINLN